MKSSFIVSRVLAVTTLMAMPCLCLMAQKPVANVEIAQGKYDANWESLSAWECPEWFKDAKFGIWAHWGPQCQAEAGDWYGRSMYYEGTRQYKLGYDYLR